MTLALPYVTSPFTARALAQEIIFEWKDTKTRVKAIIFWANRSAPLMTAALALEPGSRIKLTAESMYALANREFFINGVELATRKGAEGFLLRCKWWVSEAKAVTVKPWLLGTAGYTELENATALWI